jgi:diguanylate cyclase (GGDEF)-like protein
MLKVARLIGAGRWLLPGPFFWALASALVLGILWNEAALRFEGVVRRSTVKWLESTLSTTREGLRQWSESGRSHAEALAARSELRELTLALLMDPSELQEKARSGPQTMFSELVERPIESGMYLGASIVAPDGRTLASTQAAMIGLPEPGLTGRIDRSKAVLDGRTRFIPPLERAAALAPPKEGAAAPKWFVATPIRDEEAVVAILLLRLNLADSLRPVLAAPRTGGSLEAYAFDSRARVLTSTRFDQELLRLGLLPVQDSRRGWAVLLEPMGPLDAARVSFDSRDRWPRTRMAAAALEHRSGSDPTGYRNFLGQRVLGAWTFDEELEMGLGVEIDERDALSDVRALRWIVGLLLLGIWAAFVSAVGAIVRARRLMGRTLQLVHRATERRVDARTSALTEEVRVLRDEVEERRSIESRLRLAQRSLEESSERFARLSQIDALTNLANRRRFDEYLEREWRRSVRQRSSISLVVIEVDYFKLFNDTYGHGVGDDCLREVAEIVGNAARRPGDLVARLGGEEFAVILCDTELEGARAVAHHVRSAVESLAIDHETTLVQDLDVVTVSIGVATKLPDPNSGPSVLLYHADEALYLAKQEGRNCVRAYEDCAAVTQSTSIRVAPNASRSYEPRRS